jgi:CubicO group peptidase (beta-lactamase class C family)
VTAVPLSGVVRAGLEPVQEEFERLLASGTETGAALCVLVDGEPVVDLVGGWADAARTRPWRPDTLVHVYSTGKPFAALAALTVLHHTGTDVDSPLADAWPDYGAHGKQGVTWRHVLTHASGQLAFPDGLGRSALTDPVGLERVLAQTPAEAPPGEQVGEHCLTYGHLLGGGVRALTGQGLGPALRDRVAGPLGLDLHFGVPTADLPRVADVETSSPGWAAEVAGLPGSPHHRSLTRPPGALDVDLLNSRAWRRAEFGAIGLHATARGLARAYSAWSPADGPVAALLGPALWRQSLTPQLTAYDVVLEREVSWSLTGQVDEYGAGMGGVGGSAAAVAPGGRYCLAYVTRRLGDHSRLEALEDALLASL